MSNTHQPGEGHHILIHTDGSCIGNPGPGGYAAVLRRMDGEKEIKSRIVRGREATTTNVRMEMTAVAAALEVVKPGEPHSILLRTDSKMIVDAMNQNWIPGWFARGWRTSSGAPVKNIDLWQRIEDVTDGKNVTWEWVRGHIGDLRNEEVDELAQAQARKAEAIVRRRA